MKWLFSLLLGLLLAATVQAGIVSFYPQPQTNLSSVTYSPSTTSLPASPPKRCYNNPKAESSKFCQNALQRYSQAQQQYATQTQQQQSTNANASSGSYEKQLVLLTIIIGVLFVISGFVVWKKAQWIGSALIFAGIFVASQLGASIIHVISSIVPLGTLTETQFSYFEFSILLLLSIIALILGHTHFNSSPSDKTHPIQQNLPSPTVNTPAPTKPNHKYMKYIIIGILLLLLFIGAFYFYFVHTRSQGTPAGSPLPTSMGQPSQTPSSSNIPSIPATGWVHTSGTAIIDGSGNHIHLSGVDEGGHMLGSPSSLKCSKTPSPATLDQITSMHQMDFNTNRIGITWANIEPTAPTINPDGTLNHHWNQQYLADIDTQVQYLKQNGMMAILDMHQASWSPFFTTDPKLCQGSGMPAWLYTSVPNTTTGLNTARCEFFSDVAEANVPEKPQEGLAAVWAMLSSRYATNTTVIGADMLNEPNWSKTCTSADLAAFYEKIGAAIRSTNPNIILMYEDVAYQTYVKDGFKLTRKPALTNAVYSWHFYPPDWKTGQPFLAAHLARSQSWGVPLWIGEFDAMGETRNPGTDPNWQSDLSNQMDYFKQNDISWTLWAYDTGCCSIVTPGTTQPKQSLLFILQKYL